MSLGEIRCANCYTEMPKLADESVDLILFSPPYDKLRTYEGYPPVDRILLGKECFRVAKNGAICAVIIQDQTKDFAKSLTSFRWAIEWADHCGWKLFECCIYRKHGSEGAWWTQRFRMDHEYILLFLKGDKPRYFNKEPLKIPSKHGGKTLSGSGSRRTDGKTNPTVKRPINLMKCRGTVWEYLMAGDKNPLKRKHPAPFPDKLAEDIIQCFSGPGDLVLDPMVGSGTTCVMAAKWNRRYIGMDFSPEYCEIAKKRISLIDDNCFEDN